jgi:hypothetical protein
MTNRRERRRQAAAKRNAERLAAKDAERQAQHKPTLYLGVQGDMNTHRQAANIKQQGGKVLQPIFFGLNEQGVVVGFDEEDFRKKGFKTTLFAHDITIALEVSIPNLIGRLTHLMMARQGAPLLRDMDSIRHRSILGLPSLMPMTLLPPSTRLMRCLMKKSTRSQ